MKGRLRRAAVLIHRWVGLLTSVFLVIAGITGSVLAFYAPLDAALNPELFDAAPPLPGAPLLDPIVLRERILQQFPGRSIGGVILNLRPGKAVNYWIDERETFVNPYTGAILGSRRFGDLGEGKKNLLTFIYRFHYSLALGEVGTVTFGVVALLWTLDCFVGVYLTFPLRGRRGAPRSVASWFSSWGRAWRLKTAQLFSLVFTWHRASGLWAWGLLLVFGWSAVALNLGDGVYGPVMNVLLPGERDREPPRLEPPRNTPGLDLRTAWTQGRRLMAAEAKRRGFQVLGERWLTYAPEHGLYGYTVESTLDIDERLAETTVHFDGNQGALHSFSAPTGGTARSAFDAWLIALHCGAVRELGNTYRAVVVVLGIGVALLSVTGVWIWWRKRSAASRKRDRRRIS